MLKKNKTYWADVESNSATSAHPPLQAALMKFLIASFGHRRRPDDHGFDQPTGVAAQAPRLAHYAREVSGDRADCVDLIVVLAIREGGDLVEQRVEPRQG